MKNLFVLILVSMSFNNMFAEDIIKKDTLYTEIRNDIVVLSSTKETNSLKSLPASVTVFSPKNLESMQIFSMKDLSSYVPNFFVPNYGSRMTAPVYIRGIGARTGAQTVAMYVDNIPHFNPSVFDTELFDIQRIEVLRGTQGTLYGRNAMGGIINVYTFSPLQYQGTNASITGGNHGYFSTFASHHRKLTKNVGISASAYYRKHDGFFENTFTGKKADDSENAGARAKLSWEVNPNLYAEYSFDFDFTLQGAFPYMKITEDKVNFDGPSTYKRKVTTNGLTLRYTKPTYIVNSTTGYQYLNDDMHMDQDYTPQPIFSINQRQNQHSVSQEVTIKSNTQSDYQWSNGIFGFYDHQKITSPVEFLEYGIQSMLQRPLDNAAANNKQIPILKYKDQVINMDGIYTKPVYGAAIFHQSTLKNILYTKGLSITFGLRLDYEKASIDYNANTGANMTMQSQQSLSSPIIPFRVDSIINGSASKDFLELLPRFVLKYDIDDNSYMYLSASKGYKTGGHNVQIFADLLSSALQASIMDKMPGSRPAKGESINDQISYNPEYSWNYELGGKIDIIKNSLSTNFSFFYIDVQDLQITKFAQTGAGRMTTNAGKAVSRGFELGLKARPCEGFYLYANYGFADAEFKDYHDGKNSYTLNKIPFAPRETISLGSSLTYNLKKCTIIDKIQFDANLIGVGKTYWTDSNSKSQGFYSTVNARILLEKNIFGLEFWGRNVFDRDYQAFYFESMGNSFIQKGRPAEWGATLRLRIL